VLDSDTATQVFYQHRHPPSEIRVKVKANGDSVMFDNVSSHVIGKIGVEKNIDYVAYPASKVTMSQMVSSVSADAINNDWSLPLPVGIGSSTMQNMTLGFIDENVSQIEVILEAKAYETFGNANASSESNIRMDTVTVVLELI
jgi:hypothetical protein